MLRIYDNVERPRFSIRQRLLISSSVALTGGLVLFSVSEPPPEAAERLTPVRTASLSPQAPFSASNDFVPLDQAPDVAPPDEEELKTESVSDSPDLDGRAAIQKSVELLSVGLERMKSIPTYTAELERREVVDGRLLDPQEIFLKVRQQPFGVYLQWLGEQAGREAIYADGENDGKLVVQLGGLRGRLLGPLRLDPKGGVAMSESRHPVTEIGLTNLAEQIIEYRKRELDWNGGIIAHLTEGAEHDGRKCFRFECEYASAEVSPEYRKSIIHIDEEWLLPVAVTNYGWPIREYETPKQCDADTMLEDFAYRDVNLSVRLVSADFDQANAEYNLTRRR
ncbi:DUF1571 domain-containing protein [Stratiformator vulcanicus]|uniref:DUF1571 domain-containing protein n=1 Tax=Stratiformator vulcanicus TaxID=2527980 RepID=A0A517R221_9PLAN|nr:DUF1571 domain-containing protein [Stratiformator vulcanicus]QDT37918.1 hypothetical protein Pan189_23010 [Stratiformator vulcanicus]